MGETDRKRVDRAGLAAFGYAFGMQKERAENANSSTTPPVEAAPKKIEKDDVSLGELNPLIHNPNLARRESVDALKIVILSKIEKYGGVLPKKLESTLVTSMKANTPPQLRLIARFEVDALPEEQVVLLEELVKNTYPVKVRTRTGSEGNDIFQNRYPPVDINDARLSNTTGWYMGPNMNETDSLHEGLFVYRNLGNVPNHKFSDPEVSGKGFLVEVREASMYQTDLVEFITQVSSILGQGKTLPSSDLLYETYYDLIRLGLKDVKKNSVYGMDDAINTIKRSLLIPLASRELSRGIKQQPESVLMVGVPGTGKTLVVEELLQEETGVFILPLDPLELLKELHKDKEKQTLLPRITQVSRKTGKQVVLHIDDIENMVQDEEKTHSTLRNLMAGIQENDFYIIASTNDPEKIDQALLQPQRFGKLLYCELPVAEARREILSIHTDELSEQLGIPLFADPQMREMVLTAVTRETDKFTPRFIAEIANVAKSYLLYRIAMGENQAIGLTEDRLENYHFIPEDWQQAFMEVSSRYNKEEVVARDKELEKFVDKYVKHSMGFPLSLNGINGQVLFSREEYATLKALLSTTN